MLLWIAIFVLLISSIIYWIAKNFTRKKEIGTLLNLKIKTPTQPIYFEKHDFNLNTHDKFIDYFSQHGEIISRAYKLNHKPPPLYSTLENGSILLQTFFSSNIIPDLEKETGSINTSNLTNFKTLNKFELEGALTSHLLTGGVYGSPFHSKHDARLFSAEFMDEVFLEEGDEFIVFDLRDAEWCEWEDYWAITWTYLVYDYNQKVCWLVSFGSTS